MNELLPRISYRFMDLLITCLSFILGYAVDFHLSGYSVFPLGWEITFGALRPLSEFLLILFVFPFIWRVALNRASLYDSAVIRNPRMLLSALIKAHLGGGLFLSGFFYLAKFYFPSRSQILFFRQ